MLIAAALIELELEVAESIKDKRRVVKSLLGRIEQRFRVSVAEVADQDHRSSICIGCVKVGIDPRHLRAHMEKVVRFVESLGLAELVGDEITITRLTELDELDEDDAAWSASHAEHEEEDDDEGDLEDDESET